MNNFTTHSSPWRDGTLAGRRLWRKILEYPQWISIPGRSENPAEILLFSSDEAAESFLGESEESDAPLSERRAGWEILGNSLHEITRITLDPGSPQELVLESADFPALKDLADAVEIEAVWQRLRMGNEEDDDLARAAKYASYHLAVVKGEEGVVLIHVPRERGEMYAPVFTHVDALELALEDFKQTFPEEDIKTLKAGGAEIFPALANEAAEGIVFNYKGPGEAASFKLGVIDLVLQELTSGAVDATTPVEGTSPDFNLLSDRANAPDASIEEKDQLYSAVFLLSDWHFIARGDLPDVHPYIASHAAVGKGEPMLKAFTDTDRLHRFAKDCGLTDPAGEVPILSLPVEGVLPMLDDYADQGVWGIHFNADSASHGFYAPLRQLPIIRNHLDGLGLL